MSQNIKKLLQKYTNKAEALEYLISNYGDDINFNQDFYYSKAFNKICNKYEISSFDGIKIKPYYLFKYKDEYLKLCSFPLRINLVEKQRSNIFMVNNFIKILKENDFNNKLILKAINSVSDYINYIKKNNEKIIFNYAENINKYFLFQ